MDFKDLLFFDKMIMPKVITLLYWIGLVICVIAGLATMFSSFLTGLAILVGGCIAARLYGEMIMLFFKINEGIQDIRNRP
ncbi:MAG TPA: DUF4282 domain-containing protein [Gammaproteobacteria bacterium]|nr:DUF4282 domain-containing protein [Gammaproteobacteria bacterium]